MQSNDLEAQRGTAECKSHGNICKDEIGSHVPWTIDSTDKFKKIRASQAVELLHVQRGKRLQVAILYGGKLCSVCLIYVQY